MLESEDNVLGETFSKYLPNFSWPNEEVVYPKGDVDAVSIIKSPMATINREGEYEGSIFIIGSSFTMFLKNKIKPEERNRFHFFNSFFFGKLADPDKDPLDASKGKVAFQRVKKWTRKVNLIEKDYISIPLSLESYYKDVKVSCVLHKDSIRGSHTGLKVTTITKFTRLWSILASLCGTLLEGSSQHFNPFKITQNVNFKVTYSNGLVKVYEILDPMELNNWQLQVWEFDQDHQRWLPVAELAENDDKGDQVFSVAWAPNIGRPFELQLQRVFSIWQMASNPDLDGRLFVEKVVTFPCHDNESIQSITAENSLQMDRVKRMVSERPVVIFSKSSCILSHTIKSLFNDFGVNPIIYELDEIARGQEVEQALSALGCSMIPIVFIGGELVGGANEIMSLQLKRVLKPMLIRAGALWV
ncbi:hypothetical protein L1887_00129 [Cichorium endivia]|nr:hypothetical protein L1887_00129 [Cichorium endivia]